MQVSRSGETIMRTRNRWQWSVSLAIGGICLTTASAQTPVRQGHALDANMRVGSGGIMLPNHAPLVIATSGSGLLGSSPSGLPSDSLYQFQRDSFNYAESMQVAPRAAAPGSVVRPYYSSSGSIADVGQIINRQNQPGTSSLATPQTLVPTPLEGSVNPYRVGGSQDGAMLGTTTGMVHMGTGEPVAGQANPQLMQSTLFGNTLARAQSLPLLSQAGQPISRLGKEQAAPQLGAKEVTAPPVAYSVRVDLRVDPNADPAADNTRLESIPRFPLGAQAAAVPQVAPSANAPGNVLAIDPRDPAYAATPEERRRNQLIARQDESASTLAKPLRRETLAERRREQGTPGLVQPTGAAATAGQVSQPGVSDASMQLPRQVLSAVGGVPGGPLRTFVSSEESQFDSYLAKAEEYLKAGEYYRAADQYSLARAIDVRSPLPQLGRAMALLAAGDYLSSANHLFQAIRSFDSLAAFEVDFTAFIPDLEMLDRRRADLEQRLESSEMYRLRFLLGYAEYCSGLKQLGIQNMSKATQDLPAELALVRQFVEDVKMREEGLTEPLSPDDAGR